MKKISSQESFDYRIDGRTVIAISPEPTIVTDENADFIKQRLGAHVTVEHIDAGEAVAAIVAEVEAPTETEEAGEEVAGKEEITNDEPVAETEEAGEEVAPVKPSRTRRTTR